MNHFPSEKALPGMLILNQGLIDIYKKLYDRVSKEDKKFMDMELEKVLIEWDKYMGFKKTGMVGSWEKWEFKNES